MYDWYLNVQSMYRLWKNTIKTKEQLEIPNFVVCTVFFVEQYFKVLLINMQTSSVMPC